MLMRMDGNSFYADRIIRMLVEEGLNHLPVVEKCALWPSCGVKLTGLT